MRIRFLKYISGLLSAVCFVGLYSDYGNAQLSQPWGFGAHPAPDLGVPKLPPRSQEKLDSADAAAAPKPEGISDVDAAQTNSVDAVDPAPTGSISKRRQKPDCPNKVSPANSETLRSNETISKQVLSVTDSVAGAAMKLTGSCPDRFTDLAEDLAAGLRQQLQNKAPSKVLKENGQPPTADDWIAVDLIARTLFGELGGVRKCANANFVKAVGRVLMNRADYKGKTNFLKTESRVQNRIARVAIKPNQLQVWMEKNARNNSWLACPANNIQTRHYDAEGNVIESSSMSGYLVWGLMVDTATEMIFHPHQFRCETQSVNALFYARNDESPGGSFKKITTAKVNGEPVNNAACVQLWENPEEPFTVAHVNNCPKETPIKKTPPSKRAKVGDMVGKLDSFMENSGAAEPKRAFPSREL